MLGSHKGRRPRPFIASVEGRLALAPGVEFERPSCVLTPMQDSYLVRQVAVRVSHQDLGPLGRDEILLVELPLVVGVRGPMVAPLTQGHPADAIR
jgi:hypothetical protein